MDARIFAAFPGTGKSTFAATRHKTEVIDLDSGKYTLGYTADGNARNPDFPHNYLRAIQEQLEKTKVLLIGCQPDVLAALRKEGLTFTLIYPERELKAHYIRRFQERHSPQLFVELLSSNWELFLDFLESQTSCKHIVLSDGQYISDIIDPAS